MSKTTWSKIINVIIAFLSAIVGAIGGANL